MKKSDLARQLRERQVQRGLVPYAVIAQVGDDEIIESYVTCANCKMRQVTDEQLDHAIRLAETAEDFMRVWPTMSGHKH